MVMKSKNFDPEKNENYVNKDSELRNKVKRKSLKDTLITNTVMR